jgi:hypothetical protein
MYIFRQKAVAISFGNHSGNNEGLLFHPRLRAQRTCHIVQIPDFIPLILGKCHGLHNTIASSRRSAGCAKGVRHLSGSASMLAVDTHRRWLDDTVSSGGHTTIRPQCCCRITGEIAIVAIKADCLVCAAIKLGSILQHPRLDLKCLLKLGR